MAFCPCHCCCGREGTLMHVYSSLVLEQDFPSFMLRIEYPPESYAFLQSMSHLMMKGTILGIFVIYLGW